jgi:hypothetical protein
MKSFRLLKSLVLSPITIVSLLWVVSSPIALGQITFFTPPSYNGTANFAADFNGDGKPDILSSDGTLQLGKGDGTFTTGTPVSGGAVATGDFNGDGKMDVLQQGTGTLLVLLGNGDGTFQTPISTNSGASLSVITAGDVNGDGKADALGLYNNNLLVYLSQGDGTFAAGVSYAVGNTYPATITLGDFNGDLVTDIAVSLRNAEVVLLGNGDGTFQAGKTSSGIESPLHAVAGDFNGDGKPDLIISDYSQAVWLLLEIGGCTLQNYTLVFVITLGGLASADLNGDGKLDLVLTPGLYQSCLVDIYLGNGDGTFSSTRQSYRPVLKLDTTPAIADFNSDGKLDIADSRTIFLGNGDGTFQGWLAVAIPTGATTTGDFDKNGTTDVAAVTTTYALNPSVYILTNDGMGLLTLTHTYSLPNFCSSIAAADLNNDGNLDLVAVASGQYAVLLGNGDGSFQAPVIYFFSGFGSPTTLVIADFNGDHKLDLALPAGGQTVVVLLGNGDGTFGSPSYIFDGDGGVIVSADFNGDGKPDIAEAGSSGSAILLGDGDGTFQPASFPVTTPFPENLLVTGDLNGDGKADLIAGPAGQTSEPLLGNGDGTFTALSQFSQSTNILADINGDGIPDALGIHGSNLTVSLGNGDGTFGPYIIVGYGFALGAFGNFTSVADLNGDGKPDLIIYDSQISSIYTLINTTAPVAGATFSPTSLTFPSQTVGTSSSQTSVTLTNSGAIALKVTSVTITGANAGEFSQTNSCTTVQPTQTCSIKVTFTPTAVGTASASVLVADNAGSGSQTVALSGTGAAANSFVIATASGSPTSATVMPGSSATFNLAITPSGSFSGTVNLNCRISPSVNLRPTYTVPATVQVTAATEANITVTVNTRASTAAGTVAHGNFPPGMIPIAWTVLLLASGLVLVANRKRWPALAAPVLVLAFISLVGCGGSNSTSSGSSGTPANTYTATVTATSGSVTSKTNLTVIVQ